MRSQFAIIFATIVILLFGLIEVLLLRLLNPGWYRKRWVRWSAWGLPLFGMVMCALWAAGEYTARRWLGLPGAALVAATFVLETALMLALPVSGALHLVRWVLDRLSARRETPRPKTDEQRRLFLKGAAAAAPVTTLGLGMSGIAAGFGDARVYLRPIRFEKLPTDLEGFRILHLSDIHLGHYIGLDHLEEALREAEGLRPDLVLVTGDVADELSLLPEALTMIAGLKAPQGAFVSIGNHEYFRGAERFKTTCERSPVRLLLNDAVTMTVGGTGLFLGGIDDPVRLRGAMPEFFRRTVDLALREWRQGDFALLMSHRPTVFDYAAETGIELTLAGHTHGGQLGLGGRSLVEPLLGESYLWGHYARGGSHLYTSSGVGHWFPFRLGCPPEAPVIELRSA